VITLVKIITELFLDVVDQFILTDKLSVRVMNRLIGSVN
jgi:hypothetical protein